MTSYPGSFDATPRLTPRENVARGLGLVCMTACVLWAFLPLETPRATPPQTDASQSEVAIAARPEFDVAAFNVPLWVAPPPVKVAQASPPAPPPPPPPPLKWQLLAIVKEESTYKAVVYDPDTDKVLVLGEGDESGACRIAKVTPTSVDVRDAAGVRTLALRETGGRP